MVRLCFKIANISHKKPKSQMGLVMYEFLKNNTHFNFYQNNMLLLDELFVSCQCTNNHRCFYIEMKEKSIKIHKIIGSDEHVKELFAHDLKFFKKLQYQLNRHNKDVKRSSRKLGKRI